MTDMVEKVAQAICIAQFDLGWPYRPDHSGLLTPDYFRTIARAALESMRQPTEAMEETAFYQLSSSTVWPAMVETALSGVITRPSRTKIGEQSAVDGATK